jgi:transposase
MGRYELTEFEWNTIQPLLPDKPRGVPRVDDRKVLNGSSSSCARAWRGRICPRDMGLTLRSTIASTAGGRLACGTS